MVDARAFKTPILLIIFNRPETTKTVFESIRSVRPAAYFVAAHGPRAQLEGEAAKCDQARRIATAVDWDCDLHTLWRDRNLGAGPGVASAITWFFDHVSKGIILEDDCVPSSSFYRFCEELLTYYGPTPSVMHISGNNFQYGRKRGEGSYYFSAYTHSWGWATWRRAWMHYDFELISAALRSHVWDGQWHLSVERNNGMAVLPNVNLVKNIGFGADATHTRTMERYAMLPAQEIAFPLLHPRTMAIDRAADTLTYYANFRNIKSLDLVPLHYAWDYVAYRVRKLLKIVLRRLRAKER